MHFCSKLSRGFSKIYKNSTNIMNKSKKANVMPKKVPTSKIQTSSDAKNLHKEATFKVLPTPVKSESDKKEYRVIQLNNGLIACLISDKSPILQDETIEDSECEESETDESGESEEEDEGPDSSNESIGSNELEDEKLSKGHKLPEQKLAATGLCVGVGSFSDPKHIPGMAHFLEHMVFMGSKKYPKENGFDEFIKQNGGSDNASTDPEATVFYFECIEKDLLKAMDLFSQFFIAPLMKRNAMTRERESIESEFQMSVHSDSSRKEQLLCFLAKSDCPVNSFPWGNLITLKNNVNDEDLYKGLHEFRKRHYSAHRMTLAVQGRLTLEELQEFTLKTFSGVPNNGLEPEPLCQLYDDVFDTPDFNKIYHVIPVKDLCQIDITWAFPSLQSKYRSKPQHFISYLLGDEGKGSLLSYLKKKLWVIGTSTGNSESGIEHNSLYTLFNLNLNLTEEGYNHLGEVVEVVFSYLKMLKTSGPQERSFRELQSISNMTFKYAPEESAVEIVETLCESMQVYPPEDYITGSELYFEFDPDSIQKLLDQMTPEKANYMVLKRRDDKDNPSYITEKWFGTQYLVEDIPESWMEKWRNPASIAELQIPPPNSFITSDFSILPDVASVPDYPEKILDTPLVELWFRRDAKFKLPMAYYYFYLISPLSVRDVKHQCMLYALVNLLAVDISEEIYPATSADLSHTFMAYERGMIIKLWGFNEKLPALVSLITRYLRNLSQRITCEMFEIVKDKLVKNYHNKLLKPSGLAKDLRLCLLVNNNWHPVDRYFAMKSVTFEDMKKYCDDYFNSLYVKVLIQGNVSEASAKDTVNRFVQELKYSELKTEERPRYNVVRVNKGEKCCRVKNFNCEDANSIITNYYQSERYVVENSIIIELIMMVIEEPLFDVLRTKEQLGYHVYCSIRDTFGILGYTITVNAQATKATPQFVNERIEAFIKHSQSLLANLNAKSYKKFQNNLIKMKRCVDIDLKEEVDRNWSEITSEDYMFDRIKREIEAIEKTDLNQIRTWWEQHNSFGDKANFRKLTIQVEGHGPNASMAPPKLEASFINGASGEEEYFIKGIEEYKTGVDTFHMVAAEPGPPTTASETPDGGTTFGKLKQTLSSSLLTAQDKVVTKMGPRPSLIPDLTPSEQQSPSTEEKPQTTQPALKTEPGKPPSRAGACRVCLKAFKPDDFSRTCATCTQRVCEDCASYSKLAENEDPANWTCSVCRRKMQSRAAIISQDSNESLLEIPLQELQRRHSEARLGSSGGGLTVGNVGSGLAPPRSPELRRHSDVSPASLKELEKLKGSGAKIPDSDWNRGGGRSRGGSRANSPPRIGTSDILPAAPRSRRGSRVARQHSYDDEVKAALLPVGGGAGDSGLGVPPPMPRRASAYDVFSVPGLSTVTQPSNAGRRASFRVPAPEPSSPPSPDVAPTMALMAPEEERRRRRSSHLPELGGLRTIVPPRPTPALEDLEAAPRRQASVDAEAIRIVIHDVDSGTASAAQKRVVLRRDPSDKAHRTRGFGMRVVGGKTSSDGHLFAYIVWTVPGGPAEKGGLQQGDKVLEWGGVSLIDRNFEEVCAIMDHTGDTVELLVEHATDLRMCDFLDEPPLPPSVGRKPSEANITALYVDPENDKAPLSPTRRKLPKTPEQLAKERTVSGRIQIQVWYHDERKELVIAVLAADDLASRDESLGFGALPEAYARLCLLPLTSEEHCLQTEVAPASQNPIWNANLSFMNVPGDELMERVLEITLWDLIPHNEHAFLGECSVDLQKAFLDDRAVWCRLEDPRQLRGKSPHTSPRGSIAGTGKRNTFGDQRSVSDDVDSIGECASLLHPDHAWGSRRGSSQSEQLEVEVYQLGKDFSRSLPGSRRSSFQSAQEQAAEQEQAAVPPVVSYSRDRRRSSCTRMLRDPEEILKSLKAVKGELGRTMSLTADKRRRSSAVPARQENRKNSVMEVAEHKEKENSPPSSPERASPPRLGPGQIKPRGFKLSGTKPVEIKLGLLMTKGQLEVEVVCARHIASKDSPPDTYVKCYLRDGEKWLQKKKTRVCRHSCEPQFRQTLKYQACDVLGRSLVVMLWERQSGFEHNQGLGGAEIALDSLTLTHLNGGWYPLFPIHSLGSDSNDSP